jgi:hypothetical protein
MFEASFIFHAFGNDIVSGTTSPYSSNFWTALPLGYDCRHAERYTVNGKPSPQYCSAAKMKRGHPAAGTDTLDLGSNSPPSLALPQSAFGVQLYTSPLGTDTQTPHCCRGYRVSFPPYAPDFTYATFVNAGGSFFAGGGAAAAMGYANKTGPQGSGTWRIRAGANAFGGVMAMLGKLGAEGEFTITGKTGTYQGVSSWNLVPPLGRPLYNTVIGYGGMGTPLYQNPFSKTDMWYKTTPKGAVKVSTILAIGSGTLWTTGQVGAFAKSGAYYTSMWRTGYDNRTPAGWAGNIQLVTPGLTHWLSPGWNTHTAHIGILKLRLVPEPGRFALLALGLGALLVLRPCAGRA